MKRIFAKNWCVFLGGIFLGFLLFCGVNWLIQPKQQYTYSRIQINSIERNPDGSGSIRFTLKDKTDILVDQQLPKGVPRVEITCDDLNKVHHVVYPPLSRREAIKDGLVQENMLKGEVILTETLPEKTLSLPGTYRFFVAYCGYATFEVRQDGTMEIT